MRIEWRPALLFLLLGFIFAMIDIVEVVAGNMTHHWLIPAAIASFILSFMVP